MSSRFAAAICGHLINRESALGTGGELVEIGTFGGRVFIAMALGLPPMKKRSASIASIGPTPASKRASSSTTLLTASHGIICLDDTPHPGYPMLATAVFNYFAGHPKMRLL